MKRLLCFLAVTIVMPGLGLAGASSNASAADLPSGITGYTWDLAALHSGGDRTVDTTGSDVTVIFGTDGRVSGSAGCNSFSSSYVAGEGNTLRISDLISTKIACLGPIQGLENEYLPALQSVTSYTQDTPFHLQLHYGSDGYLSFNRPAFGIGMPNSGRGLADSLLIALIIGLLLLFTGLLARRWARLPAD